jgi:hypothetical protein
MRYAVDTTSLDDDADVVGVVLTRLGRVHPSDDLGGLARDLPGGETARATGQVVRAWRERMAAVSSRLRGLGAALAAASDAYGRVESVARSVLAARHPGGAS